MKERSPGGGARDRRGFMQLATAGAALAGGCTAAAAQPSMPQAMQDPG